jgi:hypothetical protein
MKDESEDGNDEEKVYLMSRFAKEFVSYQLPVHLTAKRGQTVNDDGMIVALVGKNVETLSTEELDLFVKVWGANLGHDSKPSNHSSSGSDFFLGLAIGHIMTKKD